jgi:hypothetical protein
MLVKRAFELIIHLVNSVQYLVNTALRSLILFLLLLVALFVVLVVSMVILVVHYPNLTNGLSGFLHPQIAGLVQQAPVA